MLIRPPASTNQSPIIIHSINRMRYKSQTHSTRGSSVLRKFSPRVNKSFTCYQEIPCGTPKSRSLSAQKYKLLSGNITPKIRHRSTGIRSRDLRSSSKISNGHPAPGDFDDPKAFKKEMVQSWFERGLSDMKSAQHLSAATYFSKVLKEETTHVDALFNRACCYMNLTEFKQAIPDLMMVIHECPMYDKKVYVALAMCFANLSDFDTAIRHLSKGLLKFPKYVEGFITRAQLFSQQMKWDKAISDFSKAVSLAPNEGPPYLGLGDAYLAIEDTSKALKAYSIASKSSSTAFHALIKRAKLYFDLQEFTFSMEDLNQALFLNSEDAESYYYKGLILLSQENLTEAALCLEQSIKFDLADKKFTGASIYNLGAIKIKQKDYYGAIHTFKRASDVKLEVKEQRVLKGYVEAILYLMKRKFKEGVSLLTRIIKRKDPLLLEYMGNCHAFRGYGLASLEKHEQAVRNLTSAGKIQELDNASKYNLLISTAILKAAKDPPEALSLLEEAAADFPKNIEPLSYQAAIYLSQARKTPNKKLAEKSKALLDKAIALRDSDSDLYYFRGLVLYYLNKPIEAVPDYEVAIDKAEDNLPIHFMARGLCYAQLKLLKEAIQDFSIAIQLNEALSEPYYYRGRCAYLLEDTQQAFQDYQKMITNKHEDPVVHIHAGKLLMLAGSVEDASKAFTNANSIEPTEDAFVQRAKCYLIMQKPDEALMDLQASLQISFNKSIEFDVEVLKILIQDLDAADLSQSLHKKLKMLSKTMQVHIGGKIFKDKHVHWYKGAFFFIAKDYQRAKTEFKAALDTKYESNDETTDKDNSEVLYNLAICYIMTQQYEAAIIHLQELVYILEGSDRGKVLLLIGILNLALQDNDQARSVMLEAFKFDSVTSTAYLEEKPNVEVLPFSCASFLSAKYPATEIKIAEGHPVSIRPSFGLPLISMPSLEFTVEEIALDNFGINCVKCKPEAPWLNRVKGTIQFTEEIRDIASESVMSTAKSDSDDNSIFDSSFSELKIFRSAAVALNKLPQRNDTAQLLTNIRPKETPDRSEILDASEEVLQKINMICS